MNTELSTLQNSVVQLLVSPNEVEAFDSYEQLRNWLIENIEWLLDHDFERLLSVLYRIDVSEIRVRKLIEQNEGEDAAGIMADLILERQAQKIESRKKYSTPKDNKYFDDEAERWD
ncbi:MAG: hypothetical protein R2753_03940 [Chitinophagales bacterium]